MRNIIVITAISEWSILYGHYKFNKSSVQSNSAPAESDVHNSEKGQGEAKAYRALPLALIIPVITEIS